MLVIAVGILGFVGVVLLAALLMVGIEAGSEVLRDLKRDPGLKIALWGIAALAALYVLGCLAQFVYGLLGWSIMDIGFGAYKCLRQTIDSRGSKGGGR